MKKIIAIVGMPGAGKSATGVFFKEKGMPVLRFGSVIDEGLQEEGLEWTTENNRIYREKIRNEHGMAAVAIKMYPKIKEALKEYDVVVLDGLYSWEEYIYLKDQFDYFKLLCVYARPSTRYERLANRSERVWAKDESRKRDIAEIHNLNKGGPIAMSDYLIINETSKEHLYKELENFLSLVHNDSL